MNISDSRCTESCTVCVCVCMCVCGCGYDNELPVEQSI